MSQSRYVQSFDGTRIAYREYGGGDQTVLLSNGLGCNQMWVDYLIRDLSPHYRVVLWDYRGHVDSEIPADPRHLTVDCHMQDMRAVMEAAAIERAILVGFSMGVQISLEFAGRYPEKVLALGLLCGPYEYPLRGLSRFGPVITHVFPLIHKLLQKGYQDPLTALWRFLVGGPWAYLSAKYIVLNSRHFREEDFQAYHPHITNIDLTSFMQTTMYLNEHTAVSILPRLNRPVLVIGGAEDNFAPEEITRTLYERLPDAEYLLVEDATHAAPVEFPELIDGKLVEFFARRVPARKKAKRASGKSA